MIHMLPAMLVQLDQVGIEALIVAQQPDAAIGQSRGDHFQIHRHTAGEGDV